MAKPINETAKNIEAILAELPTVPQNILEAQKNLQADRDTMHTWLNSVKVKGSDGNWNGTISASAEEYNKRENELAQKDAAYQALLRPVLLDHELAQKARIAAEMGKPQRTFGFGSGNSKEGDVVGTGEVKSLYQHMEESDDLQAALKSVPSNVTPGWRHKISLKGVNTSAIMKPTAEQLAAMKATLDTNTGGYPMPHNRQDLVVPFAHRRPVIGDIIPSMTFDEKYFPYMEAITWTNNAAAVAEGATKPESALGWVEREVIMQVIAHNIPMTKQLLKYGPALRMMIEQEMTDMLRLKEEDQVIGGTGTTPQLTGILTRSGIQTYARTNGENNLDAIFKSMQQVRFIGYAEPDRVLLNPDNFTPIALLKDANGNYIYGDPASPQLGTIWGKPYTQTQALPANTALTGAFGMYTMMLRGSEVIVEIGYVGSQLVQNMLTMLVEEYVAVIVKRPAAFSTTTVLSPAVPS